MKSPLKWNGAGRWPQTKFDYIAMATARPLRKVEGSCAPGAWHGGTGFAWGGTPRLAQYVLGQDVGRLCQHFALYESVYLGFSLVG